MSWLAWPGAGCSPSTIGPACVPCSRPRNSIAPVCDPALAEALLECAPADGYPAGIGRRSRRGTVWRAICRHVFEMGRARTGPCDALAALGDGKRRQARYLNVSEELRDEPATTAGRTISVKPPTRFCGSSNNRPEPTLWPWLSSVRWSLVTARTRGAGCRRRSDGAVPSTTSRSAKRVGRALGTRRHRCHCRPGPKRRPTACRSMPLFNEPTNS